MGLFKHKSEVEKLQELQAKIERKKLLDSLKIKQKVAVEKTYMGRPYDSSGLVGNKIKRKKQNDG